MIKIDLNTIELRRGDHVAAYVNLLQLVDFGKDVPDGNKVELVPPKFVFGVLLVLV